MWKLNNKWLLLSFGLLLVLFSTIHSKVISGIGYLTWGTWDFSEQKSYEETYGDIMLVFFIDPPIGLRVVSLMPPTLISVISDSTYEELRYAPTDTTLYDYLAPVEIGLTYVCRTFERHYAKFRFIAVPPDITIIEYTYQPNGSNMLFDPDSVEVIDHSWSEIKHRFISR